MKNISVTIINESNTLSFEEICRAVQAEQQFMLQLIEEHIIEPAGTSSANWEFDHLCLKRARLARNFYYELEVNIAGIGLILELLERIDTHSLNTR